MIIDKSHTLYIQPHCCCSRLKNLAPLPNVNLTDDDILKSLDKYRPDAYFDGSRPVDRPGTTDDINDLRDYYREVQLNFTPEIEVLHIMFERWDTKDRKISFKQHITYFNFRSKIPLDHPVQRPRIEAEGPEAGQPRDRP